MFAFKFCGFDLTDVLNVVQGWPGDWFQTSARNLVEIAAWLPLRTCFVYSHKFSYFVFTSGFSVTPGCTGTFNWLLRLESHQFNVVSPVTGVLRQKFTRKSISSVRRISCLQLQRNQCQNGAGEKPVFYAWKTKKNNLFAVLLAKIDHTLHHHGQRNGERREETAKFA